MDKVKSLEIKVTEEISLSNITEADLDNITIFFNDKDLTDQIFSEPPFPYQRIHAQDWLDRANTQFNKDFNPYNLAIRSNSELIGIICFKSQEYFRNIHSMELGYWLGKPHWKKGIMSKVADIFCNYGFEKLDIIRITALVFSANISSARVLEKIGFTQEGYFKKFSLKNNQYRDVVQYALLKD